MPVLQGPAAQCALGEGLDAGDQGGMAITDRSPPEGSLLADYAAREAHHTDCFEAEIGRDVTLPAFIFAFYTQPLFRAERLVLRIAARTRSSDVEARALADGHSAQFAVWTVETRRTDEILLRDRSGRTGSWLQVAPGVVRFGSVVIPVPGRGGRPTLGPVFQSLMAAHAVYSRALLSGAVRRLR